MPSILETLVLSLALKKKGEKRKKEEEGGFTWASPAFMIMLISSSFPWKRHQHFSTPLKEEVELESQCEDFLQEELREPNMP